ncbi:putative leucine-rich repeat domain, L domain-containing protein [Medicago truncatula]|uniref:Putative leucine-rich repeat domain, L domain-containing protein n=1 Tax=Medicago truncatula TaxID=3880 RepID=A0A396I5F3_MEDTR|nr:putative leucine-rich repeat domain, L domain-containing protein [Medicago truncatula]
MIDGLIPNSIWKLDNLINLNLSQNSLTDFEGNFFNFSSNLFELDLSSNKLQGPIPFIPPDIGNHLPYILILFLSNNSFQGKIHESFCNASSLSLLDLSHNNFFGTIPKCFAALSNRLRMLNFRGNKLQGHIPKTMFLNSCALRIFDLNDNHLDGTIPKSIVNCRELQVDNIGNNALTGRIPCFLSKIPTLRIMVLRSNKFHGFIGCPNSTGDWKMLHIVDLGSNNFSGMISASLLNSWKAMMRDEDVFGPEFDSFKGNEGLCGPPLTNDCNDDGVQGLPTPASELSHSHNDSSIDWSFLSVELGFIFGFGIFILPLICLMRWRLWYSKHADEMHYRLIPQLDFVYEQHEGKRYRTLRWRC